MPDPEISTDERAEARFRSSKTVPLQPDAKRVPRSPVKWFQSRVSPRVFRIWSVTLAALWFLLVNPVIDILQQRARPLPGSSDNEGHRLDFGEYYAAGLAVRHGLWDCLYPIPKAGVYENPLKFSPSSKTFLFTANAAHSTQNFYPSLAAPWASDYSERILAYCPELAHSYWRYILPPPFALFLWPLAYFDYRTAEEVVAPILFNFALFGVSILSARMYRLLEGNDTYVEGLVAIAFCIYALHGLTTIETGNISPVLSFFICLAVYGWMKKRYLWLAAAMIPLLTSKALVVNWCPLLFIRRAFWKGAAALALFSIALNAATLFLGGSGIYHQYFSLVLPKIEVPIGDGIAPRLFYFYGLYPKELYLLLTGVICVAIYAGFRRSTSDPRGINWPSAIGAATAGTMAVFCLFNFSIWVNYIWMYLFFPFLGWLAWEAVHASGAWKAIIRGGLWACYIWLVSERYVTSVLFRVYGMQTATSYHFMVFSQVCFAVFPAFFLLVAFRRLFFAPLMGAATQSQPAA